MIDQKLKMILQVFASQMADDEAGVAAVVHVLADETMRFQSKLKSEAGILLSTEDIQTALNGFENVLAGEELPPEMTSEQAALAQIFVDRMTLFKEN